jgi:glycine cleavage system H protein
VTPEELKYTPEHEWVARLTGDSVRVGITDFAQEQLGDVVFVQLPDIGQQVDANAAIGEVESTKSVSEIYSPLAGQVIAINAELEANPELVNSDPYGEGWMVELRIDDASALNDLLDQAGYRELIEQE